MRLDIHVSWAGNPDIVLKVGYKGMPLVLELSEVQFRGKVREEGTEGVCFLQMFVWLVVTTYTTHHAHTRLHTTITLQNRTIRSARS